MICGFCGQDFDEAQAKKGCGGCAGGCRSVHCPHCNYRNPVEPAVVAKIRALLKHAQKPKS